MKHNRPFIRLASSRICSMEYLRAFRRAHMGHPALMGPVRFAMTASQLCPSAQRHHVYSVYLTSDI